MGVSNAPDRLRERLRIVIPDLVVRARPVDGPAPREPSRAGPSGRLLQLPESLRVARVEISRRAVAAVAVVVLAAVGVFVGRVALARERTVAIAVSGVSAASGPSGAAGAGAVTGPAGGSTPAAGVGGSPAAAAEGGRAVGASGTVSGVRETVAGPAVVVHVVGQVRTPGLVTLSSGARVADAVAAAGGALSSADLGAVNLARLVADGEQVRVPSPGETLPAALSGGSAGGAVGGVVDLNTAGTDELESLPGIGPVLAERIVDWRTGHGRFASVDDLGEVSGIGEKLLAGLRGKVRV